MRANIAGKTELLIFSSVKLRAFKNLKGNFQRLIPENITVWLYLTLSIRMFPLD